MTSDRAIALTSIAFSGTIAISTVVVPFLLRKSERKHEAWLRVREARIDAYLSLTEFLYFVRTDNEKRARKMAEEERLVSKIHLWSSSEVWSSFSDFLHLIDSEREGGPKKHSDPEVKAASQKLHQQMTQEVQEV